MTALLIALIRAGMMPVQAQAVAGLSAAAALPEQADVLFDAQEAIADVGQESSRLWWIYTVVRSKKWRIYARLLEANIIERPSTRAARSPATAVGLPGYAWDKRMRKGVGAYIDLTTGRMVSQAKIEDLLLAVCEQVEDTLGALGRLAAQGDLSPAGFYEAMQLTLRQGMNAAAALSKGGWAQMEALDWGRNGWLLREQYLHLRDFAAALAAGKLSAAEAEARARLYTNAVWGRYWEMEDARYAEGYDAHIRTKGDDKVCTVCRGQEAMGWRPVLNAPPLPLHLGCRCRKSYRKRSEV